MTKKTLAWQILSFMVAMIAGYNGLFNEKTQIILGLVSFAITAVLNSPILSTGTWPKGWNTAMWITQIAGVSIQVANYTSEHAIIAPMVVNMFVFTVNTILVVFVKQYNTEA